MDLMNRVYKPYLDKFMIVFIDDISICLSRNKEYEERLRLILGLLKNKEFCLRFDVLRITLEISIQFCDALSRIGLRDMRVRVLVMTINSNLLPQIHKAQVESPKTKNVKDENLHGMDKELRLVLIELPVLGAGVGYHALET
ncbi:hypothetical protein Tco_1522756 [Tanacetum coccineum]